MKLHALGVDTHYIGQYAPHSAIFTHLCLYVD